MSRRAGGRNQARPVGTEMGPYRLSDGVGFARFNERTIVLDTNADRYWQLGQAAGEALDALANATHCVLNPAITRQLAHLKLITADPIGAERGSQSRSLMTACAPDPCASALEATDDRAGVSALDLLETFILLGFARLAIRCRSLRHIIDFLVRRRAAARATDADIDAVARSFARCRRFLPFEPACLPDAAAFIIFASRRRLGAQLIFGVEAFPFAAHCWAQQGDRVLTDPLDHVRMFKPILVV